MSKTFDLIKKYCPVCNIVTDHLKSRDQIMCSRCHRSQPLLKM